MSKACGAQGGQQRDRAAEAAALAANLEPIRNRLLVLSGKGGVGKSTVAVNLALALAGRGLTVGLLDIDIHGPSVPAMLGIEDASVQSGQRGILPVETAGLKVMSIGLVIRGGDTPVIWRGPLKMGVIEQFLREVEWGPLDWLVVDAPPGTGDEPLSIAQLIPDARAVVVTTPQRVATVDVRKSITFCRQLGIGIVGVVENMNGVVCPDCGRHIALFPTGRAKQMADEMGVPLLASLPLDPAVAAAADRGEPARSATGSPVAAAFERLAEGIIGSVATDAGVETGGTQKQESTMIRIAVPTAGGRLCSHFGHCETFAFIDLDQQKSAVVGRQDLVPPPHEPGVIPRWVASQGANVVLAGGMGARAVQLFEQAGVQVVTGCQADTPEALALQFAGQTLITGANACGHDGEGHTCGH